MSHPDLDEVVAVPADWFQNGFHRFLESFLRRHFHAIAVESSRIPSQQDRCGHLSRPVLIYCNHPSWWDPLMAHFINRRLFWPRQMYAPIDASALQHYKVFKKLGFFGVDMHSTRGAAAFLKTTHELFSRNKTALWLTPEGRFADVRDQSAELMPGLAHLCNKTEDALVIPLSLEYVFWEERLPECLFRFGDVVSLADYPRRGKAEWSDDLTARLRDNQTELSKLVVARSAEPFTNLLHGKQGVSGVYEWSRRLRAWFSGDKFHAAHGDKFVD